MGPHDFQLAMSSLWSAGLLGPLPTLYYTILSNPRDPLFPLEDIRYVDPCEQSTLLPGWSETHNPYAEVTLPKCS